MDEKITIFYILLLSNAIHGGFVQNTCETDEVKSNGTTVCRNRYNDYRASHYRPICQMVYPIIKKIISCSNLSITNIISNVHVDEDVTIPITLKVTGSNFEILPTSIFINLKQLTILYLQNSNIQKITPGAFNFLDDLKELYLDGNRLMTISDGLFNSLTLLEKLDLSRNQIQDISAHAFQGARLTELYLSHNNLSQLSQPLLHSLTDLQILDVSWNNLSNMTSFNNLPLSSLNLNHNAIDVVDFEFLENTVEVDLELVQVTTQEPFETTKNLKKASIKIDLSFNSISEIINFNSSEASEILLNDNHIRHFNTNMDTEILDLSYNELETIVSGVLGATLRRFNAGNNLISRIETGAFFGLHELEYLLLNNNSLSSLPNSCFKDLSSLLHLDLSRNKLTYFTFGTFDNLQSLQVLDISYNSLKHLHQKTFHALANLMDFSFENNEISDINMDDLKLHMPNLSTVSLDGNVWSCNKLVDVVHQLRNENVSFPDGNNFQESNVHGIKCYDTLSRAVVDEGSETAIDVDYKRLNSFFNEDFTKTLMYKYFNEDFKDSNFFKYLESLNNNTGDGLNAKLLKKVELNSSDIYYNEFERSGMFNYFNKDFRNSTFFKYLENFKGTSAMGNGSEKIIGRKLEEGTRAIKATSGNNPEESLNFNERDTYKNFTDDLEKNFKRTKSLSDRAEKVVSTPEVGRTASYNSGLLTFILLFLIINTGVLIAQAYFTICRKIKYGPPRNEEVELI